MADIKQKFNTAGTLTCSLASLTTGSARQSTVIDNSTNLFLDALIMLKVKTGAASTSATGTIEVYAIGSVDGGTTYTDGGGATDAGITLKNARLIGVFAADANATTFNSQVMSVAAAFGGVLPARWAIVVKNNTGGTLDVTEANHGKFYQELYYTVV